MKFEILGFDDKSETDTLIIFKNVRIGVEGKQVGIAPQLTLYVKKEKEEKDATK